MPLRQVTLFRIGCWSAIVTALIHLAGHIIGPPPPTTPEAQMVTDVAQSVQFELPGGSRRTIVELLDGLSLAFVLLLATLGATGVIVQKRAGDDALLMQSVARAAALGLTALLIISIAKWFIIPTVLIAFSAVAFALASVRQPA